MCPRGWVCVDAIGSSKKAPNRWKHFLFAVPLTAVGGFTGHGTMVWTI
nr:MAG TPA: hypothetical protein [Caudoviricetes sp.]